LGADRQQTFRCLTAHGERAPKIQFNNVDGWFIRVEHGLYALADGGRIALVRWRAYLPAKSSDGITSVSLAVAAE
jgi:hypothetical protein